MGWLDIYKRRFLQVVRSLHEVMRYPRGSAMHRSGFCACSAFWCLPGLGFLSFGARNGQVL